MIRLACALALLAMMALLGMVFRTSGGTATLYAFLGIPALALAISIYLAAEGGHVKRLLVRWLGGTTSLWVVLQIVATPGAPAYAQSPGEGESTSAYARSCAQCHGADGQADTAAGRAMKVPPLRPDRVTADSLIRTVRENPKHRAVSARADDETLRAIADDLLSRLAAKPD